LTRWGILVFDDKRRFDGPNGALSRFLQTMFQASDDYGMTIDRKPVVDYGNFNAPQQAVHAACETLYKRVEREKGGPPEMLMFIIKGKSAIMYEHVKQFCDNVRGVQSQVMDSFNVQRKGSDRSYHANLLLKVNTKLGGTTVALQASLTGQDHPTVYSGLVSVANGRCLSGLMYLIRQPDPRHLVLLPWLVVLILKGFVMLVHFLSTKTIGRNRSLRFTE
jgi:Piwi domain